MEIWIILRFSIAAAIIALVCWSLASAVRDSWQIARRMHSIPCSHCRYFTNDYRLKCSVQPRSANTEQAIDCGDYFPRA